MKAHATRVERADNLFDFFHEAVKEARPRGLPDDLVLYLAELLSERARADRPAPQAHTLAELHAAAAAQSRPGEQARTLRELGDRALYDLGYFREHLARGIVSLDYYETMGRTAYHRTHRVLETWFAGAFGTMFADLAEQFHACVGVVERVRAAHDPEEDLGRLLERWKLTGDEELAERLRDRGLILPRGPVAEG